MPINIDKQKLLNQAIETLVLLLAPFSPHVAEEMWQMMGKTKPPSARVAWPAFDEKALKTSTIVIAVQVNGRVRAQIEVTPDMSQEELRKICLADPVWPNMPPRPLSRNLSSFPINL